MYPFIALLLVGGCGVCLRYSLQSILNSSESDLPLGTILANLMGCFLIGVCSEWLKDSDSLLKLALMTGFMGGLTTLSSFGLELLNLLKGHQFLYAFVYWVLGSCISVVSVFLGIQLVKLIN